jgi:hypothetical protein
VSVQLEQLELETERIENEQVRQFYGQYLPQRRIILDFYEILPDSALDYRMVDKPERNSDSPRESLGHLIEVQRAYFEGIRTGEVRWDLPPGADYGTMDKRSLIDALVALDREMAEYVAGPEFDPSVQVDGGSTALDVLYLVRDHDILHVGWNLALIDHLGIERYPSLVEVLG